MKITRIITSAVLLLLGALRAAPCAAQQDAMPAVVIDVRTEAEWNAGHLEGAVLVPHDRIESGIKTLDVDRKSRIYLYCRSGRRTAIAFDVLKKAGYADLVNLKTLENASKTLNRAIVK